MTHRKGLETNPYNYSVVFLNGNDFNKKDFERLGENVARLFEILI